MNRWLTAAFAAFIVWAPSTTFADKPRQGLQTFDHETVEVKSVAKRPSKVRTWVETEENDEAPAFPWKAVLGALACFATAAPFAWKFFNNVNEEIAATKASRFGDQDEGELTLPPRTRRKVPGRSAPGSPP
jgi:hypothetical protein